MKAFIRFVNYWLIHAAPYVLLILLAVVVRACV
jgi:hypothetical protein